MTATFKTTAMKCNGCASSIRALLSHQPGVTHVHADAFTKLVTVEFDEAATAPGTLVTTLTAAGFPVDPPSPTRPE